MKNNSRAGILVMAMAALSFTVPGRAEKSGPPLEGKIIETMDAASYTYLHIETGELKTWVAVPQSTVAVGQQVTLEPGLVMQDFKSTSLNRTFPEILLSNGILTLDGKALEKVVGSDEAMMPRAGSDAGALAAGGDAGAPAAGSGSAPMGEGSDEGGLPHQERAGSGASAGAPPANQEVVAIEKIEKSTHENGYTVADVHAKREEIAGKSVSVRGKVVKALGGIMDRNWIHLRDGSGDPSDRSDDLTVTSQEMPKVGSVVTVQGTVSKNKDFGGGYFYAVVLEEGTVVE